MALLHDPALTRILKRAMQRVFSLLINELSRLGAKVIYADFHRFIVDTGKRDIVTAIAFGDFLSTSLSRHPMFDKLALKLSRRYDRTYRTLPPFPLLPALLCPALSREKRNKRERACANALRMCAPTQMYLAGGRRYFSRIVLIGVA